MTQQATFRPCDQEPQDFFFSPSPTSQPVISSSKSLIKIHLYIYNFGSQQVFFVVVGDGIYP